MLQRQSRSQPHLPKGSFLPRKTVSSILCSPRMALKRTSLVGRPGKSKRSTKPILKTEIGVPQKFVIFLQTETKLSAITPNGELFFFGSERPIPNKPNAGNFDMNIWMMKKTGEGWSNPKPLPFPINDVQIEGEEWPSSNNNFLFPLDDETFYYTTMVRGSDAIKLYEITYKEGVFSSPVEINGIFEDPKYWVYSAVVSPDGEYLIFNSYGAPGGLGGEDIFVSKRTKTGWSPGRSIGPKINSKDEESGPRFSRDGKYFFFTRAENLGDYEYGEWNIYFMETAYLELDKLFE